MKTKLFLIVLVCSLFNAIISCKNSDNRISIAKEGLEEKINNESRGLLKLNKFEKTDGQESSKNGIQKYTINYKAEIEFKETAWANTSKNENGRELQDAEYFDMGGLLGRFSACHTGNPPGSIYPHYFPKGEKIIVFGSVALEKSESGWHVVSLN
ncbi:MAG: hypothetical protein WC223_01545 [Bacteroidales bacterium]|jgi:hypothetical protein